MSVETISIQSDSIKRITQATPVSALAELIWNALDADATEVAVEVSLEGLEQIITVKDNGHGIKNEVELENFIKLGGSWKKNKTLTDGNRNMHGEKGEGRLKGFSLGHHIEWRSGYIEDGKIKGYSIKQSFQNIRKVSTQGLSNSEAIAIGEGTTVIITDIQNSAATKLSGTALNKAIEDLKFIFAPFLITYHDVNISINGVCLDPRDLLAEDPKTIIIELNGREHELKLFLWERSSDERLYLCKKNGTTLSPYYGELNKKINTYKFNYSAFLSSDLFNDDTSKIPDLNEDSIELISEAIVRLNNFFEKKEQERKKQIKDKWIKDDIYPYSVLDEKELSPVESTKRNVFDVFAMQIQNKIKSFERSPINSKKFTFRLLAQALEENPKAIRKILSEVLSLSDEEQSMFADILDKMELSSIIKSAKLISDRLLFLNGLEQLLEDSKKDFREVDQLHKILEEEAWIFDENFTLSASESRVVRILEKHLSLLKYRCDVDDSDIVGNPLQRVDLMLTKTIETKTGYFEHLVVELKRPSKKIDWEVLGQIQSYARTVASSDMFDKRKTRWKFMAVSNSIADDALENIEDGRVLRNNANKLNIEVYIFTWAEIIGNARARLKFVQDSLEYRADDADVRQYLMENYDHCLPESYLSEEILI